MLEQPAVLLHFMVFFMLLDCIVFFKLFKCNWLLLLSNLICCYLLLICKQKDSADWPCYKYIEQDASHQYTGLGHWCFWTKVSW